MTDVIVASTLPTRKLSHTTPSGRTFTYTVTILTDGCYLLEADHTHCVRQFACPPAQSQWWKDLKKHLDAKYPAPVRTGDNSIARRQREMMQITGEMHPYRAHSALMAQWLGGK